MAAQQCWHLCFISTWIFVLFSPSAGLGGERKISLSSTVFVALRGEDFFIDFNVTRLANQSKEYLICSHLNHQKDKFRCEIPTPLQSDIYTNKLSLINLRNGEYSCKYQDAEVYWFLRVQDEPFKEPRLPDDTRLIAVAVLTGVLLVFGVIGSVYVFGGHWQESITECGKINRKQKQKREEKKENDKEEESVDVTAPSTSCYASLEPRPRSIYDVLNRSAANTEPEQSEAEPKDETAQTTESQSEDVFESVYENF